MTNTLTPAPKLEHLEQAVYSRQYQEAAKILSRVLPEIDAKMIGIEPSEVSSNDIAIDKTLLNTRLAGAITALLADPSAVFNQQNFEGLMAFKRQLRAIFMASGFKSMDHIPWQLSDVNASGERAIRSESALRKLIMVITPSSPDEEFSYTSWIKQLPGELSIPFWLSFLDSDIILTKQSSQMRQTIALMSEQLAIPKNYQPNQTLVTRFVNAWMLISYMDFPEKHQPKHVLNKIIHQYAISAGVKAPAVTDNPTVKNRPTILIAAELFKSNHAMYRCYKPLIESLKNQFNTVCLCLESAIDEPAKEVFDEVQTFAVGESLKKIAGKVVKIKPDVIYYPSLGMDSWTVALAQFRFAPLQFMTLGHPATSYLTTIDWVVTEQSLLGDPSCFSEKILLIDRIPFIKHSDSADYSRIDDGDNGPLKIAVNAKLYKINYKLIEACQKIAEGATKAIEFHFFPNVKGITLEAFTSELNRQIPEAKVHPLKNYKAHIIDLQQCDVALNPFPFGNTNGIVDCAQAGIPFVCLDGKEVHAHTDAALAERLGYQDDFVAQNVNEYVDKALRLINDTDRRLLIRDDLLVNNRAEHLFAKKGQTSTEFSEAVSWLYRNQSALKKTSQHCWQREDWRKGDVS
jgi:hypothetical protein